jgi:hypothetical protein
MRHRRNLSCRCTEVGVIRTLNLGSVRQAVEGGKKIAIRWHNPEYWRVPIGGADEIETAGI